MKTLLRKLWREHRARKAAEVRRKVKLMFFWEDFSSFRAGKITADESLYRRLDFYEKVDAMSDEEILR